MESHGEDRDKREGHSALGAGGRWSGVLQEVSLEDGWMDGGGGSGPERLLEGPGWSVHLPVCVRYSQGLE